MLGGDIFILQPIGFLLRLREDILRRAGHAGLRAGGAGQAVQARASINSLNATDVRPHLLQQRPDDALVLGQQCREQMQRQNLAVVASAGPIPGHERRLPEP